MSSNFYTKKYSSDTKPAGSGVKQQVIYAKDNLEDPKSVAKIYGDITYSSSSTSIKPEQIFKSIRNTMPEEFGSSGLDDVILLELLGDAIVEFTARERKWDFLSVETKLKLIPGQLKYPLPSNYDQMISVFFTRDTGIYNGSSRKVEVVRRSEQDKNFTRGQNYFVIKNNVIEFVNLELNALLDQCGACGSCNHCKGISGLVDLHYHIIPPMPQKATDNMNWFPNNITAQKYFKEVMIEKIYVRQGVQYVSPSLDSLFSNLQKWDSDQFAIDNKKAGGESYLDFSNLYKKR